MVTVLEPQLSKLLQTAIDTGDYVTFEQLMAEHKVHGASFLHAANRKNSYPMINRTVKDFTNKNFLGKLRIAAVLFNAGASAIPGAPYGYSVLAQLLHEHSFLRIRPVKFEVFQFTMQYAYELVAKYGADVNFRGRVQYYTTLLENVVRQYEFYETNGAVQMQSETYRLAEAMLERGAQMGLYTRRKPGKGRIDELLAVYKDNTTAYVPPALSIPAFEKLSDAALARQALQLWNMDTPKALALKAVALLQERAYLHANWGFEKPEMAAITLLQQEFDGLEKTIKKQALADLKKLSIPQKDLLKLKTSIEMEHYNERGEILPMKTCYDDAVYNRLYETVINHVG